ncbi:MAG: DUF1178 family protein [Burkholderiales bacterium]
MIVLNLACERDHLFEGWFGSADDFDLQAKEGAICCPVCGSAAIARQLSAPYVNTGSIPQPAQDRQSVAMANSAQMFRRMFVEHVLKNTEDVGPRFADEARKIHYKEVAERAIRGRASNRDVAELKEEGIDVLPIPGIPALPNKLH